MRAIRATSSLQPKLDNASTLTCFDTMPTVSITCAAMTKFNFKHIHAVRRFPQRVRNKYIDGTINDSAQRHAQLAYEHDSIQAVVVCDFNCFVHPFVYHRAVFVELGIQQMCYRVLIETEHADIVLVRGAQCHVLEVSPDKVSHRGHLQTDRQVTVSQTRVSSASFKQS